MADDTFYNFYKKIRSKASNMERIQRENGILPGKAYLQGVSLLDIHTERGLLPVIGRDGYKNIVTFRLNKGGATNRTIVDTVDRNESIAFIESDRLEPSRFHIRRTNDFELTLENYTTHTRGVVFPNGEKSTWDDLGTTAAVQLITSTFGKNLSVDQKIPVPLEIQRAFFRNYTFVYFDFKTTSGIPKYHVTFPDGGVMQVPNFRSITRVIGAEKDYDDGTPYTDLQKFDPILFVSNNNPPGLYPDVTPSESYKNSRAQLFNGIIEPFKIRTDIYDLDTFAPTDPIRPNKVSGEVEITNEFFESLSESLNVGSGAYEDVGSSTKKGSSLLETHFVSSKKYVLDPYIDRDAITNEVDEEFKGLLNSEIGRFPGILPQNSIAYSAGHDGIGNDKVNTFLYRGRLR